MVTLALYRTGLSFTPHGENIYHPTNRNNKVKSTFKEILLGIFILGLFGYNNTVEADGRMKLNDHPLKWVGSRDRTESPVTGRLAQPVDLQPTCLYQIHHRDLVQNDVPNIP